jgi:hypothetical protein
MAIAHSFVFASLWIAASATLIAVAAWTGLRALGCARLASGLGAAALAASPPVIAGQAGGAYTDPTAAAWLVTAGALGLQVERRPALAPPALLAAGLAAGTKTTALVLSATVAAIVLWQVRGEWRRIALPLGLAAAGALVVGGTWYARTLIEHGSPLWPYVAAPWGDPKPALIDLTDISFLDRPGPTLSRVGDAYLHRFLGGLLLLAGALAAPLLARTRAVALAALATAVSLVLWLNAPLTGVFLSRGYDVGTAEATRYLLPGLAAAVLTLGLAIRESSGAVRTALTAWLGAAAVVSAWQSHRYGFPAAPPLKYPLAGAVAGLLGALALRRSPRLGAAWLAAAAAVVAGALLTVPASHFTQRHVKTGLFESGLVGWFRSQPPWRDGRRPVASSPTLVAPLAGPRLRHPLELIADRESCAAVARRARRGWVVLSNAQVARGGKTGLPRCRPAARPLYADSTFRVYGPGR